MTHRIYLDSVWKARNASEGRKVNRATLGAFQAIGDGDVIRQVCEKAIAEGMCGMVTVWRGDTLCFKEIPLEKWAAGKALSGEQPEHLKRKAAE